MSFQDQRNFCGVVFNSSVIRQLSDLDSFLPHNHFSEREEVLSVDSSVEVAHLRYYSKSRFSSSPELENLLTQFRDGDYYEYPLYLAGFSVPNKYLVLAGAPFVLMIKEIFEQIHRNVRPNSLIYHQVKLSDLVDAVEAKRHLGGHVKLTHVEMIVLADSATNTIALRGPDVVHSYTFAQLRGTLKDRGIGLTPRKCSIHYDNHEGQRLSFRTDQFGNFYYRMAKGASNLAWFNTIFNYLFTESLVDETPIFPPVRSTSDSWEEADA